MNFCAIVSDLTRLLFFTFLACLLQTQMIQGVTDIFEDADACEVTCTTEKLHTMCETEVSF